MFEKQIENIKTELFRLISGTSQFIYLNEILENPFIEDYFKNFFAAEVDWWLYEENINRENSKNFNFFNNEIQQFLSNFDDLLLKNARFDITGYRKVADSAAKTKLNVLLRPRTALKWFVYRGEPTKPIIEIVKRLNYINDYNYLIQGFLDYLNENNMLSSSKDLLSIVEFEKIIEDIDNEKIFELSPLGFIELINPIYEFFNNTKEISDQTTAPIEALIIFLDDKNLVPLTKKLENILYNQNIFELSVSSFLSFISELLSDVETGKVEPYYHSNTYKESGLNEYEEMELGTSDSVDEFKIVTEDIEQSFDKAEFLNDLNKYENDDFAEVFDDVSRDVLLDGYKEKEYSDQDLNDISETEIFSDNNTNIESFSEQLSTNIGTSFTILNPETTELQEVLKDNFDENIVTSNSEDFKTNENIQSEIIETEPDSDIDSSTIEDISDENIKEINIDSNDLSSIISDSEKSMDEESIYSVETSVNPDLDYNVIINEIKEEQASEIPEVEDNTEVENIDKVEEIEIDEPIIDKKKKIGEIINPDLAQEFILNLFYSDDMTYNELIDKINISDDWDSANKLIDNFYTEFGVFPEAAVAIKFKTMIKLRYE